MTNKQRFKIFQGKNQAHNNIQFLLDAPPWRTFEQQDLHIGQTYQSTPEEVELVNAALCLRRPLLVTGQPGTGKSSLAYAVAYELNLGKVLRWSITSRSTLKEGLYDYDAIGRLQEFQLTGKQPDIGRFIRLGPLGTALIAREKPRVLLIDEIDKSDFDLPNDLLHIFEQGEFDIPELRRMPDIPEGIQVLPWADEEPPPRIKQGRVACEKFPFVVFTSNGERSFPPAFLRRCLRLDMQKQTPEQLTNIVQSHLKSVDQQKRDELIDRFLKASENEQVLATDQLLNAIYLVTQGVNPLDRQILIETLLKPLNS